MTDEELLKKWRVYERIAEQMRLLIEQHEALACQVRAMLAKLEKTE